MIISKATSCGTFVCLSLLDPIVLSQPYSPLTNPRLPQVTSLTMWRLWLFGHVGDHLCSFRKIMSQSFSITQRSQFSRAKFVMDMIQARNGTSYDEIAESGIANAEKLFLEKYKSLFENSHSADKMNYATAYKYYFQKL